MSFDLSALAEAIAAHGPVARVAIVETRGSAPREPGASMLVWPGGQMGTIGGGALEYELAARARGASGNFVDTIPLGPAMGQCCGGAVTVVCEIFETVPDLPQDTMFARRISGTGPRPRPLAPVDTLIWRDGWLVEPLTPPQTPLWIYGAGHVGRALVNVLSPLPHVAITWVDTGPERFPDAPPSRVRVLPCVDPARAVAVAPSTAHHLILTYSHAMDLDLCHAILSRGFAAAGLIGSDTKWTRFRSRLRQLGHTDAQISRIRCPIGQKAFGKHPHAIAVGVAADLVSDLSRVSKGQEAARS